jgi:hypothetical protein
MTIKNVSEDMDTTPLGEIISKGRDTNFSSAYVPTSSLGNSSLAQFGLSQYSGEGGSCGTSAPDIQSLQQSLTNFQNQFSKNSSGSFIQLNTAETSSGGTPATSSLSSVLTAASPASMTAAMASSLPPLLQTLQNSINGASGVGTDAKLSKIESGAEDNSSHHPSSSTSPRRTPSPPGDSKSLQMQMNQNAADRENIGQQKSDDNQCEDTSAALLSTSTPSNRAASPYQNTNTDVVPRSSPPPHQISSPFTANNTSPGASLLSRTPHINKEPPNDVNSSPLPGEDIEEHHKMVRIKKYISVKKDMRLLFFWIRTLSISKSRAHLLFYKLRNS